MWQTTGADLLRGNRRTAWLAFAWVLTFLAWHVVWYVTGLGFPEPSDRGGTARAVAYGVQAVIIAMIAVGTILPVAFAMPWGRRLPRTLLLTLGWIAFGVLGGRTMAGVADTVLRLAGARGGLTGLSVEQVMGTASPGQWDWVASYTTDGLFALGAVAFGVATLHFQRATSQTEGSVTPVR